MEPDEATGTPGSSAEGSASAVTVEPYDVIIGPYDVSEAPGGVELLDLGSLKIPAVEGVEIRVQAGEDGTVQQIILVHGDSALQLGAFAAPRTEGIWDETRAEIKSSLSADGVVAEEIDGEYGIELRARVRTPEGLTDLRFVGIDGPRWMVRAVYQGKAAVDPVAAAPLVDCLRGVVVERGKEAMPAREALPLRLPREVAEQAQAQPAGQGAQPAGQGSRPAGQGTPSANGTAPRRKPTPRSRRQS